MTIRKAVLIAAAALLLPAVGLAQKKKANSKPAAAAKPAVAKTAENPASVPAEPAVDLSKAPAEAGEKKTYLDEFFDKVKKGGVIMIILLALSVIGVGYILERLVNLRRGRIATPGLTETINELYLSGQFDELHAVCKNDRSALSRIILAVVDHRNCSVADVQTIAGDIGSRVLRNHLQKAYPLAIIATMAPLLGLLGTIIGMIGAFGTVASVGEMGNASILADDIAKALVTTAGGLIVAIPMLGCYHFFKSRTNNFAIDLEEDVSELISAWFLKDQDELAPAPAEAAADYED